MANPEHVAILNEKNLMKIKFISLPILVVLFFAALIHFTPSERNPIWPAPIAAYSVADYGSYELAWVREGVYIMADRRSMQMDMGEGVLVILGSLNIAENSFTYGLDGDTGNVAWRRQDAHILDVYKDMAIVSRSGFGNIAAYEVETGELIWRKIFLSTKTASDLIVEEDLVFVHLIDNRDKFALIDANSGKVVDFKRSGVRDIYLIRQERAYSWQRFSGGFYSINTNNKEIVWSYDFEDRLFVPPVFDETRLFIRTGEISGKLFALSIESGELIWENKTEFLSNQVVCNDLIYMISKNGKVVGIDAMNGKVKEEIIFSEKQFEDPGATGGFFLATNSDCTMLFVYLGDARQLYGLRSINGD